MLRRIPGLFALMLAGGVLCAQSPVDPAVMQVYAAHAVVVTGQVTRVRDNRPWAVSSGERVPVRQIITTAADGYARFELAGGSSFELFSNSRVVFRQNTANTGDLLDVLAGRVRIHLQPVPGQMQQRVFTPFAIISTHEPTTIALAVDENEAVRVDVMEGEIHVQHTLLPRNEPVMVKAIDAILIYRDEPISRQVDRGSLYHYTVKSLHDLWVAIMPGHSSNHSGEPIEGNQFLADDTFRAPIQQFGIKPASNYSH